MHLGPAPPSSMHLTLFVPDLLWPDYAHRQAFEFDQSNPLARFLFLATHTTSPFRATDSWESVLAVTFGVESDTAPLGALRLLGEKGDTNHTNALSRTLLCADPVSLDFIQQSLVLSSPEAGQLSPDDCNRLIASLNAEFADEGCFFAGNTSNHWYFSPSNPDMALPNLAACSRLLGRRIDADESRQVLGREGLRWLNRIQMCLNGHPVNEARQMNGLTAINSVWPWGAGALSGEKQGNTAPFAMAIGDNALLRGLCTLTGTPHASEMTAVPSGLLLDTRLSSAIAQDDLDAWKIAVNQLTTVHITPALDALTSGALTSFSVIAPDAYQTHRWTLNASHKGLKPSLIQRCLGRANKHPELATLVASW